MLFEIIMSTEREEKNPIIPHTFYHFPEGGGLCFLRKISDDYRTGEFIRPDGDICQWEVYHFRNPRTYEIIKDPLDYAQALRKGVDEGRFAQSVQEWANWIESLLEEEVQKPTE